MRWTRAWVLVAMLLVWLALWGSVTPLNLVGGVVVVVVLTLLFPLPHVRGSRRVSPVHVVVLGAHVLLDLLRSSVQIAWLSIRPGPPPAGAIVAVQLREHSDSVLVTTAQLLTLVPGTLTVDMDVPSGTLYVHVPVTGSAEDVPAEVREQVHRLEARVRRALPPVRGDDRTATPRGRRS